MRKFAFRPYLFLLLVLFSLLSLPIEVSAKWRALVMTALSPTWCGLENFRLAAMTITPKKREESHEIEALQLKCATLDHQVNQLHEWLLSKEFLEKEKKYFKELADLEGSEDDLSLGHYFQRRQRYLGDILLMQMQGLPARVVFREPAFWGSTLWLGVGLHDNEVLGKNVVAKNSPVVVGNTIVGVVEEVLQRKCRVRLITDSSLTPSVRAVRGSEQDRLLISSIDQLMQLLSMRSDLEVSDALIHSLAKIKSELGIPSYSLYLAKGELHGSSAPLWRGYSQKLKGVGFNYDFPDEEGESRELRTGAGTGGRVPLLKVGDLLVTTGMDGVFPPDFLVAQVIAIAPLKEGGCAYGLEAVSTAPALADLREVCVLPPRS